MKSVLILVIVLRTLIAHLVIIEVFVPVFQVTQVIHTELGVLLSHPQLMIDAKKTRTVQVKRHVLTENVLTRVKPSDLVLQTLGVMCTALCL